MIEFDQQEGDDPPGNPAQPVEYPFRHPSERPGVEPVEQPPIQPDRYPASPPEEQPSIDPEPVPGEPSG